MSTASRQRTAKRPSPTTKAYLISPDGPGRNKGYIPSKVHGLMRPEDPTPKGGFGKADTARDPAVKRANRRNAAKFGVSVYKTARENRTATTPDKAAA